MASASEIHGKLAGYLSGNITLEDFEDWFVPSSWNSREADDLEAWTLLSSIELRLSEYSSGHLTEEELRKELESLSMGSDQTQGPVCDSA